MTRSLWSVTSMNLCRLCTTWLALALGLCLVTEGPAAAAVFKAGTAKRDITHAGASADVGLRRSTTTCSRRAQHLDPLQAVAIVIQAGDDETRHRRSRPRSLASGEVAPDHPPRIESEAGIKYSFIAGSHTHHGPVLELSDEDGKGRGRFEAAHPLRYISGGQHRCRHRRGGPAARRRRNSPPARLTSTASTATATPSCSPSPWMAR